MASAMKSMLVRAIVTAVRSDILMPVVGMLDVMHSLRVMDRLPVVVPATMRRMLVMPVHIVVLVTAVVILRVVRVHVRMPVALVTAVLVHVGMPTPRVAVASAARPRV